jgi:hypothetical protein
MRFVLNIPLFPGPDLTCSVAQFQGLSFGNITATIALSIQVAPRQAITPFFGLQLS